MSPKSNEIDLVVSELLFSVSGIDILVQDLSSEADEISTMSADVLSHIACSRRARKQVRVSGGFNVLVSLRSSQARPTLPI